MNPGITEEVGQTARTLVEALKSAPAIMALVIFNVLFMVLMTYAQVQNSKRWDNDTGRWKELVENTMKLCLPAGYKLESDTSVPLMPPEAK